MWEMARDYDFISHLTLFCRVLRQYRLLVGPQETSDAIRALTLVDVVDWGRVYWSLRALLLSRHEEIGVFDELFERFWNFEPQSMSPPKERGMGPGGGMREFRRRPTSTLPPQ